jgi:outer membrane protein assembly factor BamB
MVVEYTTSERLTSRRVHSMSTDHSDPPKKSSWKLRGSIIATLLFLTFAIVGANILRQHFSSHAAISGIPPHTERSSSDESYAAKPGQSGLYATAIDGIYRLDMKDGYLKLIWHYEMKALWDKPYGNAIGAGDRVNTAVTIADGVAYFGGNDGAGNYYLYALSTVDGSLRWSARIGQLTVAPVVVHDRVFVGEENDVFALSSRDGSVLWKYHYPLGDRGYFGGMGAVAEGRVYIGSANRIFALDAVTGRLLWNNSVEPQQALLPPEVVDGILYDASSVTCPNCAVELTSSIEYAYNPATGVQLWHTPKFAGFPSLPTVAHGVAYFGSQDGSLSALNVKDGTQLWRVNVDGSINSSPQVVNGVVYVGAARYADAQTDPNADHGHILALNAARGSLLWSYRVPDASYDGSEPLIVAGGVVYVATGLAMLYTLRASTGTQIQRYTVRIYDRLSRDPSLTLVP